MCEVEGKLKDLSRVNLPTFVRISIVLFARSHYLNSSENCGSLRTSLAPRCLSGTSLAEIGAVPSLLTGRCGD